MVWDKCKHSFFPYEFFCFLSSFPLICLIDSDANTFLITCPEARDCESFNFVLFSILLWLFRFFTFHILELDCQFLLHRIPAEILIGILLNLWSAICLLLFSHRVVSDCGPMNCSTPGFSVHHYLPKFAQTHVPWVSDTIHSSHLPSPSSLLSFNFSQHQGLFQYCFYRYRGCHMDYLLHSVIVLNYSDSFLNVNPPSILKINAQECIVSIGI